MSRHRPAPDHAIADRLEGFLTTQERIVGDFERSLKNAKHFIDLATISLEREPGNTEVMLEQVMEIDLLGHVTEQFENFQSVATLLEVTNGPLASDPHRVAVHDLHRRYEALIQEAEQQAERISALLATLRVTS